MEARELDMNTTDGSTTNDRKLTHYIHREETRGVATPGEEMNAMAQGKQNLTHRTWTRDYQNKTGNTVRRGLVHELDTRGKADMREHA